MMTHAFLSCRPGFQRTASSPDGDEDDILMQPGVVLEQIGEGSRDASIGVGVDDGCAGNA